MKLLGKLSLLALAAGAGATALYAAPGDFGAGATPDARLAEMIATARSTEEQVRNDYRVVLHLQQIARKQKDVIKLNCVNDKLVQLKAVVNIAERSRGEIEGSVSFD